MLSEFNHLEATVRREGTAFRSARVRYGVRDYEYVRWLQMIVQPATNAGPILNVTSHGVNEVRS